MLPLERVLLRHFHHLCIFVEIGCWQKRAFHLRIANTDVSSDFCSVIWLQWAFSVLWIYIGNLYFETHQSFLKSFFFNINKRYFKRTKKPEKCRTPSRLKRSSRNLFPSQSEKQQLWIKLVVPSVEVVEVLLLMACQRTNPSLPIPQP